MIVIIFSFSLLRGQYYGNWTDSEHIISSIMIMKNNKLTEYLFCFYYLYSRYMIPK